MDQLRLNQDNFLRHLGDSVNASKDFSPGCNPLRCLMQADTSELLVQVRSYNVGGVQGSEALGLPA